MPKALNVTQSSKQYWRMAASLTLKTSFVLFTVIFAHFSKFLFAGNANPYSGTPFFDPMLDGRKEIAKYNNFMDEIFTRMNIAIKAKHLDPMDLKLLPSSDKVPRAEVFDNVQKVRPCLTVYCRISLNRSRDLQKSIIQFSRLQIEGDLYSRATSRFWNHFRRIKWLYEIAKIREFPTFRANHAGIF